MVTLRDSTHADTVCFDQDYFPYGQEVNSSPGSCPQSYKFTGYERDTETGLDYAFARYYNPRLARFMSVDPLAGDVGDPQSLNRYAYVQNNSINFTDPTGMFTSNVFVVYTGGGGRSIFEPTDPKDCEGGCKPTWADQKKPKPRKSQAQQTALNPCSIVPDALTVGGGLDVGLFLTGGVQLAIVANGRTGEVSISASGSVSFGLTSFDIYGAAGAVRDVPRNSSLNTNANVGYAGGVGRWGATVDRNSVQVTAGPSLLPVTAARQVSATRVSPSVPFLGYALNLARGLCKLVTGE